jgi:multiple sugar transport system ATP-binding protein
VRKPRPPADEIDREVKRVAEIVGLAGALDRRAGRLSVNDMQKVALGRSMIVHPAIFLLDEPFSNLDAAFRAYMRAELKRIQHEGGQTMVYVTHDQVEAMGMADRIAVMNLGVLQQYGTPDEIYNRPANRFVANFVGSILMNFMPARYENGTVQPIGGESRAVDVSDRRGAVESRPDIGSGLTLAIRPERIEVVAPDAPEVTVRAKVSLVEPLGAKDVIHLSFDGQDVRAVGAPGNRPRIGDNLGLVFPPDAVHVIDDGTGLVLR